MKMKVAFSAALCACFLAVAAAFGNTPEEVALGFFRHLRDGNATAAKRLCTPKAASMVPAMIAVSRDENSRGTHFKVTDVKIHGDTAEVEITSFAPDGDIDTTDLDLKKIGEEWKVDLHK